MSCLNWKSALATSLTALILLGAQAQDRDLDNDGLWDYDRGGIDRDVDNEGLELMAPAMGAG